MSDPVKPTRPGGRSARVRADVLSAVSELIAECGLEGVQLPEVARRAGVNKTTVYRRWASREELVRDLAGELAFGPEEIADTGSLPTDVEALLTSVVNSLRAPVARALVVSLVSSSLDPAARSWRDAFWQQRFRSAGVVVERAVARGELPDGIDQHACIERLVAPIYFRIFILGGEVTAHDIEAWARTACSTG